jgi:hydrogenase 3 maturation protease
MGIGQAMNGDDAAGIAVVRALLPLVADRDHVLVIEAAHAPENQTGPVRRFAPDLVLLIDAAQMDAPPGTVHWLDWRETDGLSATTHTLPPYMLAKFFVADLGCDVALIGIQPAGNALHAQISAPVQAAVDDIAAELAARL